MTARTSVSIAVAIAFVGASLLSVTLALSGTLATPIANADDHDVPALATDCVFVEPASEFLLPIPEVIPLQLFSYAMALEHGIDVDSPRNLSKAVIEA